MKNTKCIIAILLVLLLLPMTAFAKSMDFTISSYNAYISDNGITEVPLDVCPVISNDRTLVPIRVIAENFGADVSWDGNERTVNISKPGTVIVLKIDDNTAFINGTAVTLDVVPQIINDRTMLPLRFISENLNMKVEYIASTKQIYITDESPAMTINGYNVYLDDFRLLKNFSDSEFDYEGGEEDFYKYAFDNIKSIYTFGALEEYDLGYTPDNTQTVKSDLEIFKHNYNDYSKTTMAVVARFYQNIEMAEMYLEDLYANTNAELTESEIKEIYDKDYICAKHILVSDKAAAEELLKKIKKGADFDELMNTNSEDSGLSLYPNGYIFTSGDMIKEFEDAAFKLKAGEVSGIVETVYGYHIIKREELPDLGDYTEALINENATISMREQLIDFVLTSSPVETFMTEKEILDAIK